MSANMDKGLYQAPVGISAGNSSEDIQVQIVPDDQMGMDIEATPERPTAFDENLAEAMDEQALQMLGSELVADYEDDVVSRRDWLDTYLKGLKLLGLKYEDRSEPWPGACGVTHPLLMETAVKFQSEAIMETFPAAGPVRTKIIGKETPEKVQAAQRVQEDLNYELTEVMIEYRPEHERMLLNLCLSGNAFKKIYFDPSLQRQTAPFIPAEDIVVPYGATSIEAAERVTHKMRKTKNELKKLQVAGFYRDIDLGDPPMTIDDVDKQKATEQGFNASSDNRYQILEMHVECDLPGYEDKDGIKLPYVVTIEKGNNTVLAIRRNWLDGDPLKLRRQHFVHYGYIPGFGFYYFGLIHLIGGHSKSATSLLRQLVDAGTLSNLPGGLKARGLRLKGDDTPIGPGEWRDVDLPSGAIRDNILPLPYKEPSQVLMALMDKIVMDGRQFASAPDLKVSDMSSQSPVGTTLAILERALKVLSAVQARIHYTMKQEFKLLSAIIRDNTPEEYSYEPDVGPAGAKRSDYDHVDVLPVSDPNASTMAQKVVQYQAVMQLAGTAPQIYNLPLLHRQMIEVIGVKNAAKLVPSKDDMKPVDPISENMAVLMGKPVKAFLTQDHEAHLAVHMSAMQDPKLMAVVGQNPQAQTIMAAASAHIMEHVAFQYRREIEKQLGAVLPPPPDFDGDDDEVGYLPPEIEVQLSQMAAAAAARLLQKDKAEAQAQQNAAQSQDPLVQMQQQELQIKNREVTVKEGELKLKMQESQQESDRKNRQMAIDSMLKGADVQIKKEGQDAKNEIAGAQLGASAVRDARQANLQEAQHHHNVGKDTTSQAIDLHKHGHAVEKDMAGHAVDLHKHGVDTAADMYKHQTSLADQAQAREAAAKKSKKPNGGKE
jgi:hypothetical protein